LEKKEGGVPEHIGKTATFAAEFGSLLRKERDEKGIRCKSGTVPLL
jgi:hypothetical protein